MSTDIVPPHANARRLSAVASLRSGALLVFTALALMAPTAANAAPSSISGRTGAPNSMTVLGDSISAGTGTAGLPSSEQKDNSWATGVNSSIQSLYLRLKAVNPNATRDNQASNGKKMSDMAGQASSMPASTEWVVLEMGGNDLCKDTVSQMTSPSTYRSQLVAGLNAIASRNPNALITVASIPDIFNLWFLRGAPNPPNDQVSSRAGTARTFWDTLGVIPCKSLVDNPTDMSDAANYRRWQVRDRTIEFNSILADECSKRIRCRFDNNALFNFSSDRITPSYNPVNPFTPSTFTTYLPRAQWQFVDDDISTIDHFHPSIAGHTKVARVEWESGYDFTNDAVAPVATTPSIAQTPMSNGIYRVQPTVSVGYFDPFGMRGLEYRIHTGSGAGPWTQVFDSTADIPITSTGVNWIETRGFDVNGNSSDTRITEVNYDPSATAVPTAPRSVGSASILYRKLNLSWQEPIEPGGLSINGYRVEASSDGGNSWSDALNSNATGTSTVVEGLTPGTSYKFRVKAINSKGESSPTVISASTLPTTAPPKPISVSASGSAASATVSWSMPVQDGGLPTTFTVTSSAPNQETAKTCTTSGSSCTVTGLTNGTAYTFTVKATNSLGASPTSSTSDPATPLAVPGAPFVTLATSGNGSATAFWNPPSDNGGMEITGYTAVATPVGGGEPRTCSTTGATNCTVTGLTNGQSYTFTVSATNALGTGSASGSSSVVVPLSTPGAPTIDSTTAANGSIIISWSAPASDGGSAITSYTVTASPQVNGAVRSCSTSGTTSCSVTGLSNGTPYTFVVTASNVKGAGTPSVASAPIAPKAVPGSPSINGVSAGNGSVTVSWSAPSSAGGSAITGYSVIATPQVSGQTKGCTAAGTTSCTVTGLVNGQSYTFTVSAENSAGSGPASAPSNPATPVGKPAPPTFTSVTRGNGSAIVTWTPPTDTGGSAILSYTVSAFPAVNGVTKGCTTTISGGVLPTTCEVTGLTNGVEYSFVASSTNRQGTSLPSARSDHVIPAAVPGQPAITLAVAGDATATITWTPPASDGGLAITNYTVTAFPLVGGVAKTCSTSGTTSCTISGLTNGTGYSFTVTARNELGTGLPSGASPTVTPKAVPPAPVFTALTAAPVLSSTAVTFTTSAKPIGAGSVKVTITMLQGTKKSSVCTATKAVTAAGTVAITCKGSSTVRSALKKAAGTMTVTTVFTPSTGAATTIVETINVAKKA